jgi:hypothetical protein
MLQTIKYNTSENTENKSSHKNTENEANIEIDNFICELRRISAKEIDGASHYCPNRDQLALRITETRGMINDVKEKVGDSSVTSTCTTLSRKGSALATFLVVKDSLAVLALPTLSLDDVATVHPTHYGEPRIFTVDNYFHQAAEVKDAFTSAVASAVAALIAPAPAVAAFIATLPSALNDIFERSAAQDATRQRDQIAALFHHVAECNSTVTVKHATLLCDVNEVVAAAFVVGTSLLIVTDRIVDAARLTKKQIADVAPSASRWHYFAVYGYFASWMDVTSMQGEIASTLFPCREVPDATDEKAAVATFINASFLSATSAQAALRVTRGTSNAVIEARINQVFGDMIAGKRGLYYQNDILCISRKLGARLRPSMDCDVAAGFAVGSSLLVLTVRTDGPSGVADDDEGDPELPVAHVVCSLLPHGLSCLVVYNYFTMSREQAAVVPTVLYDAMFSLKDHVAMFSVASRMLSIVASTEGAAAKNLFIAASHTDFNTVCDRHVGLSSSTKGVSKGLCNCYLASLDSGIAATHDPNNDSTLLVGGESGIGKTMEILTGHLTDVDLVVYLRFAEETLGSSDAVEAIKRHDKNRDPNKRNAEFGALARKYIETAMEESCPGLHKKLLRYVGAAKFTIRVCFDEVGYSHVFVKACCGLKPSGLRAALEWDNGGIRVEVLAAGTGVGTAANGGSENSHWRMTMLALRRDFYWRARVNLIKALAHPLESLCVELLRHVQTITASWNDPEKKAAAMHNRRVWLESQCATEEKLLGVLVLELVFAGVEADNACTTALENARLAALIVVRCRELAAEIMVTRICCTMSGANIRRQVLLPVALQFQSKNALCDLGGGALGKIFVEAHRYALFDGYDSISHPAHELVVERGVLVDNLVYKKVVPDGYEAIYDAEGSAVTITMLTPFQLHAARSSSGGADAPEVNAITTADAPSVVTVATAPAAETTTRRVTYIACCATVLGRYSISPAMVLVLSLLMANSSQDMFGNVGDVFERAIAQLLFFAVQIFHERPVEELVAFFVGSDAVIGANVIAALNDEPPRIVEFARLELRTSGSVNMDTVLAAHRRGAAAAAYPNTGLLPQPTTSGRGDVYAVNDVHRMSQLSRLWATQPETAWVEVSPRDLPYADVVLHIPGALTLAVSCKDRSSLPVTDLTSALNVLRGTLKAGALLHQHLVSQTQTTVTPVLCLSHTLGNGQSTSRHQHTADEAPLHLSTKVLEALGDDGILVHGTAVRAQHPSRAIGNNTTAFRRNDANATRIHNVRHSLLQFDFRERESMMPVVIAAVSDLTPGNVTTSVYNGHHVTATQIWSPNVANDYIQTIHKTTNAARKNDTTVEHCDRQQHNPTIKEKEQQRQYEGGKEASVSAAKARAQPSSK